MLHTFCNLIIFLLISVLIRQKYERINFIIEKPFPLASAGLLAASLPSVGNILIFIKICKKQA